jgi:hypothetical protein
MFSRGGKYYMLEGGHCCFCRGGKDIAVYVADTPMGPWTLSKSINPLFAVHTYLPPAHSYWHEYTLPCQQAGVLTLHGARDAHGEALVMWIGDGWQQAPDARKEHDPQWWAVLRFDAGGTIQNLTRARDAVWTVPGCREHLKVSDRA